MLVGEDNRSSSRILERGWREFREERSRERKGKKNNEETGPPSPYIYPVLNRSGSLESDRFSLFP